MQTPNGRNVHKRSLARQIDRSTLGAVRNNVIRYLSPLAGRLCDCCVARAKADHGINHPCQSSLAARNAA
jgi:hypothetical protein